MSSVATINTLVPNATVPLGYFDEDNIRFIQEKISQVLSREFVQKILIDRDSIVRLMNRALVDGRIESVPKMNMRVVMMAANNYRTHQLQVNKHLNWETHYVLSQLSYDPSVESSRVDLNSIRPPNRIGKPMVGGTTRFFFT